MLKEKIQILESQLKIKEHQPLLEKSQLEESVKRTQSILDLTREQFDQSLTISRKEADIQSTKLDEKKREIELLYSEVSGLRERLDKSQDEVIQLKIHISSISVSNTETFTGTEKKPVQFQESNKPNVFLIGTSNVKGVHETRLSASLNIKKFVKYTIDETKDFVKDYNEPPRPDLVVIHPFTNDLKTMTPQNCVQSLQTLIVDIQHK